MKRILWMYCEKGKQKLIYLSLSENCGFKLKFDNRNINRFTMCKLMFVTNEQEKEIYEDYIYIFIENILGRICNIPSLKLDSLFGKIGKWQEYYYYDTAYVEKHSSEIEFMEGALFLSAEKYGIFLYEYKGDIWMELNKGFSEFSGFTPYDYYCNPNNYRVSLNKISEKRIWEWKSTLEQYRNLCRVR